MRNDFCVVLFSPECLVELKGIRDTDATLSSFRLIPEAGALDA